MTSVLLIYPYFKPPHKSSSFLFPPLGLGYIASILREAGHEVNILDCTFLKKNEAFRRALGYRANVVGIYCMVTMLVDSLKFARLLRNKSDLLVAGGPLPSSDPVRFLSDFDIAVIGEGEQTMLKIVSYWETGSEFESINGVAFNREKGSSLNSRNRNRSLKDPRYEDVVFTEPQPNQKDLDAIPFPSRDLFPNTDYISYWKSRVGHAYTSVITTRGCPFSCEFCSRSVFGISYRERSPKNVVDELEEVLALGYDRVHFADDVFTLNKNRVFEICQDIRDRGLSLGWECLGRVDSIDLELAKAMKSSGCERVLFGIESGCDAILDLMGKKITVSQAERSVVAARDAGLKTGAFFILCYPGETDDNVLDTLRFATYLPLDYVSFTMPHTLPGTPLYERVKNKMVSFNGSSDEAIFFDTEFSNRKMQFAILKGEIQFEIRKRFGKGASLILKPFEVVTDDIFRRMK